MGAAGEAARQKAETGSDEERGCGKSESSATFGFCGLRGGERSRDGGFGQVVAEALQVAGEVLGGGVALLGVLGEQAFDDPAHGSGSFRRGQRQRLGFLPDDRDERLRSGLSLERALARGHLVDDRAEGELIGAVIHGLAARLLGRHVSGCSHDGARFGRRDDGGGKDRRVLRRRLGQLGQAEVEDLDVAVLRDHQVLGLQVAMDDARGVSLGEAFGDLGGEVEEAPSRQRLSGGDELAQGLSSTSSMAM